MGIDTFDGIDWFEDFSDVIVAQQNKIAGPTYGSWQTSSGRGEPVIITEWALLTLEKAAPPPRPTPTPEAVPILTPIGLIALIGLLSVVAIATIRIGIKKRR